MLFQLPKQLYSYMFVDCSFKFFAHKILLIIFTCFHHIGHFFGVTTAYIATGFSFKCLMNVGQPIDWVVYWLHKIKWPIFQFFLWIQSLLHWYSIWGKLPKDLFGYSMLCLNLGNKPYHPPKMLKLVFFSMKEEALNITNIW